MRDRLACPSFGLVSTLLRRCPLLDHAIQRSQRDKTGTHLVERVDAAGTHTFEWTSRNELDRYLDPLTGEWIDYVWTDSSKPDLVTYGTSGLVRDYDYDTAGLLETDVLTNGATTVSAYDYLYDDDGNLVQKSVTLPGNAMSGVHDYSYDDGGRLKTWDAPGQPVVSYVWDDSGNRTAAGTDSWTYDERNRLMTGPDGSYTYDARGTVSEIGTDTLAFDASGRLVDFNGEVEYSYDGLDRVATRLAGSSLDVFTYAGMGLDPVADGTFTYSRTPAGRVMAQTDGTDVRWAGLDRHGDLTGLLDPVTGTMTDTVVFDPFGDAVSSTGTTGQTLGFQGDYTDPASGEVWMGARWYNGGDAAFRSRDTVFGELSTPISLNRYTYGWANPNAYWDPDGRAVDEIGDRCRDYWSLSKRPRCDRSGSDGGGGAASPTGSAGPPEGYKYAPGSDWENVGIFGILTPPTLIPDIIPDANFDNTPIPRSTSELAADVIVHAQQRSNRSRTPSGWNCDAGSMMAWLCDTAGVVSDLEIAAEETGYRVEACRKSTCGAVISLLADIALDVPKSIVELGTGTDPITGDELGYWRALGVIPFVSIFRRTPADEFFGSGARNSDGADLVIREGNLTVLGKSYPTELDYAGILVDRGYDVVVRGRNYPGPDLLVNGIEYELKTLNSATQNAVINNALDVAESATQGSRVIINGVPAGLSHADGILALERLIGNTRFDPIDEIVIETVSGRIVWP